MFLRLGIEYGRKTFKTFFCRLDIKPAMTDIQPPRHSPSDIAVKSNGYTYMRRAMIIPTCVVQIYS